MGNRVRTFLPFVALADSKSSAYGGGTTEPLLLCTGVPILCTCGCDCLIKGCSNCPLGGELPKCLNCGCSCGWWCGPGPGPTTAIWWWCCIAAATGTNGKKCSEFALPGCKKCAGTGELANKWSVAGSIPEADSAAGLLLPPPPPLLGMPCIRFK